MNVLKIIHLVEILVTAITPELKTEFSKALDTLEAKAKTTQSPVDDVVVKLLRGILGA